MLLTDHAKNVASLRCAASAHDDCHDGVEPPHAADNFECALALPHDGEVSTGYIAQAHPRHGTLQATANPGIYAQHAVNLAMVCDHHMAKSPRMSRDAQEII